MKTIAVAELRRNPTAALADVEAGESYNITRRGRAVARLVPVEVEPMMVTPTRETGPSDLAARPQRRSYEEVEGLLVGLSEHR